MPIFPTIKALSAATTLLVMAFLPALPIASASEPTPKTSKPPCRIDIDNAHLSTSVFHRRGVRVVIVKARSICNVLQQRVLLTVQIYKTELLGDRLVTHSKTNPQAQSSSGYVISNNGTTKVCATTALTRYYGIAYSKALINGKWLYAGRTQSPKTISLACGT